MKDSQKELTVFLPNLQKKSRIQNIPWSRLRLTKSNIYTNESAWWRPATSPFSINSIRVVTRSSLKEQRICNPRIAEKLFKTSSFNEWRNLYLIVFLGTQMRKNEHEITTVTWNMERSFLILGRRECEIWKIKEKWFHILLAERSKSEQKV